MLQFVLVAALAANAPQPRATPALANATTRADSTGPATLATLVSEAFAVRTPTRSAAEYAAAARRCHSILDRLKLVDRAALGLDDQVDYDLLDAHLRTRLHDIEQVKIHQLAPASYVDLSETSALFLREGAIPDAGVRGALRELRAFPAVLASAKANLTNPARVWTENAMVEARYARMLLDDFLPRLRTSSPALGDSVRSAATIALAALDDFSRWMERDLLPRSTRSAAWTPEQLEFYQFTLEQLPAYPVDEMLRIAEAEEKTLLQEMTALAKEIHPSGDLKTVWELMKEEAPPWEGVLPMAARYVRMAADWLQGAGAHVVTIPDFDYGARLTDPMSRRGLSFGGATYGPTVAGRISGYYVLTPLEPWLSPAERASRIKSYNPYWTHVISYHEWLGHTAQRAAALQNVTRPMRRSEGSGYFSQAWSFYLEKLLEDEGYYDVLPHMEKLKTMMARRQMRMWRLQRIITKGRMAKGEMTFEQAVQAYVEKSGMEPTNAFIEVQRDSQSPRPPGREVIGEREVLRLREEYKLRMGEHYSLKRFNDNLLTYGDLPFRQIRRLMFRD